MRLCLSLFIVFSFQARAEFFKGPVASSLGGAGRAGMASAEGALINPAIIPLIKDYEFTAYFRDGELGEGQHRQGWAVGAVDNSEGVFFPGAGHYGKTRDTGRSSKGIHGEIWHLAGAYLFNDRLSVGFSAYRLHYKSKFEQAYTQWSGSLGTIFLVSELISVAYVFDNIARPGSATPIALREDPKHTAAVFAKAGDIMTFRADVQLETEFNPKSRLTYMGGLEVAHSDWLLLRMGYRLDDLRGQKFATAGIGFNGPRLKFDYAFEKNTEDGSGALHSVDLRVPF